MLSSQAKTTACCSVCNKKLRPFTVKTDWADREMHKACWLRKIEDECIMNMYEAYKQTQERASVPQA